MMTERWIRFKWFGGNDTVIVDIDECRDLTEEEIAKKYDSIVKGEGTPAFLDDANGHWLNTFFLSDNHADENRCVKIVQFVGGWD